MQYIFVRLLKARWVAFGLFCVGLSASAGGATPKAKNMSLNCPGAVELALERMKAGKGYEAQAAAFDALRGRAQARRRAVLTPEEFQLLERVEKFIAQVPIEQLDPLIAARSGLFGRRLDPEWNPGAELKAARQAVETERSELAASEGTFESLKADLDRSKSRQQQIGREMAAALFDRPALQEFRAQWKKATGLESFDDSQIERIEFVGDFFGAHRSFFDELGDLGPGQLRLILKNGKRIDIQSLVIQTIGETDDNLNLLLSQLADQFHAQKRIETAMFNWKQDNPGLSRELREANRRLERLSRQEKRLRQLIFERILEGYGLQAEYAAFKRAEQEKKAEQDEARLDKAVQQLHSIQAALANIVRLEEDLSDSELSALNQLRGALSRASSGSGHVRLSPEQKRLLQKLSQATSSFDAQIQAAAINFWLVSDKEKVDNLLSFSRVVTRHSDLPVLTDTPRAFRSHPYVAFLLSDTQQIVQEARAQLSASRDSAAQEVADIMLSAATGQDGYFPGTVQHFQTGLKDAGFQRKDLKALMPIYKHLLLNAEAITDREKTLSRDELARKRLAQWIMDDHENPNAAKLIYDELKVLKSFYWTLDRRILATGGAVVGAATAPVRAPIAYLGRRPVTTTAVGLTAAATLLGLHRAHTEGVDWAPSIDQQIEFVEGRWSQAGSLLGPQVERGGSWVSSAWNQIPFERIPDEVRSNRFYDFTDYGQELGRMPYVAGPRSQLEPHWNRWTQTLQPSAEQAWQDMIIFIGSQLDQGLNWWEHVELPSIPSRPPAPPRQ